MTSISANGATDTLYIQDTGGGTIQRKINDGSWTTITSWPATITNSNPGSSSRLKILFSSSITLNSSTLQYFVCGSTYLQFGSDTLDSQGNRTSITIDGLTSYPGLIQNGTLSSFGKANVSVYNLSVTSANGTTLADDGGWICQTYFANGVSENYIVNCNSDGTISGNGGGIVGAGAGGSTGGSLTLRGCSSSGEIGISAGGLVGYAAGGSSGSVSCEMCWSTGSIASDGGGIFGGYAGVNQATAVATNCYSTGVIQNDGGGIFGGYAGESIGQAIATKCYSRGEIQGNGGGIFGRYAAEGFGTTSASNCYSSGSVATTGYGIYGVNQQAGATSTNCYAANNSWSDSTANLNLTGVPGSSGVGTTWIKRGSNVPYELNGFGYTPYTTTIINSSSELIQSYSQNITPGQSTVSALAADASGNAFELLRIEGGVSASYTTITMSAQTGSITTTLATAVGTYTITLRSVGSYNITTFILTISPDAEATGTTTTCCTTTINERGIDYAQIVNYRIGNRLLLEVSQNPKTTFDGYSQYVKYKMAQGSRKV